MNTKPQTYLELGNIPDDGAAFECDGKSLTIHTAHMETDIRGVENVRKLRDFLDALLKSE